MCRGWGMDAFLTPPEARSGFFQSFGVGLRVAAKGSTSRVWAIGVDFPATVADEHQFDLLLEGRHIGDVCRSDAATTENSDLRELVEIRQSDGPSLHAAHREPGHGAMGLIGNRPIRAIDPWYQVID